MPARRRSGVRRGRGAALGLLAALCLGPAPAAGPPVVVVVGASGDGRRLQSAREGAEAAAGVRSLVTQEADWVYAALGGRWAVSFVEALRAQGVSRRCLFADGNRAASLLARAPDVLEGSVFVGGPAPELLGRQGEDRVATLLDKGFPVDVQACRALEAVRRVERARKDAGRDNPAKIAAAVSATTGIPGVFGPRAFEPHGGVRRFLFTWWRARDGRIELWQDDLLPTPDCGPPLGFGHPPPSEVNEARGRIGFLTYGEGETRTIEQHLLEVGLSTGGVEPDLDAALRAETLHRAIRVAHRLFRREVDGAAVPGWSWAMSFTTALPEDRPRSKTWAGIVAGDHPAAEGHVIGSGLVAIYATFLKRTTYRERKPDPPLSAADRPLLDGFASAVGLTLSHEFGHLCGRGHDTEHPTSIMNVGAGAGASWEEAVWIPDHQKSVTTTLGIGEP